MASITLLPQPSPTWDALWHCWVPGSIAATAQADAALAAFEIKSFSARHFQPVSVLITLLHLPRVQGLSIWDVWIWARNSWETPNTGKGETTAKPKFLVKTRMDSCRTQTHRGIESAPKASLGFPGGWNVCGAPSGPQEMFSRGSRDWKAELANKAKQNSAAGE